MMQLLCNGVFLDLYANTSVQFTRENPLFSFDNLKCERSTSFDIPATHKNDRVFNLARWIQTPGTGMRRRYDAQMQFGTAAKDGYLYVDSYADGKYKAIFVTGELLGLLKIKNAGKIADIIQTNDVTPWNSSPYTPSARKSTLWSCIRYDKQGSYPYPSVRLYTIMYLAMQKLGVNLVPPTSTLYVRYIPGELNGLQSTGVTFEGQSRAMATDGTYPICYLFNVIGVQSDIFGTNYARVQRLVGTPATYIYRGRVRQIVALQELNITFPDDWDDNLFIGYFLDGDSSSVGEFSFLGGRSFDEFKRVTGESLRGRTVNIPSRGKFTIISIDDYIDRETSSGRERGWGFSGVNADLVMAGGDIKIGDVVRLQDNLPDITVTDLLKIFAAISGKQLYYTYNVGITFDDLDFNSWSVLNVTGKVRERGDMMRKFGDYARNNIVQFNSGDSVPSSSKISISYTIDNDNLEEIKDLQTIPYSEGISNGYAGERTLLRAENGETLADADTAENSMLRVQLLKNSNLQLLCDASTSITLQVSMSLLEYEGIQAKTAIYYEGALYVWTEAQYSKDVVTLKLSKINL